MNTQEILINIRTNASEVAQETAKYTAELSKLQSERAKQAKQLKELQASESATADEILKAADALAKTRNEAAAVNGEIRRLDASLKAGSNSLNSMRSDLNKLLHEFDNTDRSSPKIKSLTKDIQRLQAEIKDAEQATGRFQRNVGNYGDALKGLGDKLRSADFKGAAGDAKDLFGTIGAGGVALGAAGIAAAAVGKGLYEATNSAMAFNKELKALAAENRLDIASKDVGKLKQQALDVAGVYGVMADEVVKAQNAMLKAGADVNTTLGATPAVLALATAGGLQLSDAADLVARSLTQFNIDGEQAGSVADMFAKAANMSTSGVDTLAVAMKYLSPLSKTLKADLGDLLGVAAELDQLGFGGEQASKFATGLNRLASPTKEAQGMIEQLGLKAYDARGKFIGMANLIDQLNDKLGKYDDKSRQAALSTIFGSEASGEFIALMAKGGDELRRYTTDIGNAAKGNGAFVNSIAKDKVDAITQMKAELHSLSIEIGETFAPAVAKGAS